MTSKRLILPAALVLALVAFALIGWRQAWWSPEVDEPLEPDRLDAPPPVVPGPAPVTLRGTAETETGSAEVVEPQPRLSAREGTFSFHYRQGWSFARESVVPIGEADLVFERSAGGLSSVTLRVPGGGIASAAPLQGQVSTVKTARALYESLVRGHAADLRLRDRASGLERFPAADLFLARTRRLEWVKLAIVDRIPKADWQESLVTIAYALRPDEPVFLPGSGALVLAGFEFDLAIAAARDEEFQAELERVRAIRERPIRERLAALDARAARYGSAGEARGAEGRRVSAVLTRRHAQELGSGHAYRDATYSFEHETRDDEEEVTHNDWDFVLDHRGERPELRVCTVTDDRSLIADLGPIDLETALRGAFPPGEGGEHVLAVVGHTYLVHTLDRESDYWILMRILEITPGEDLIFEWVRVEDPEPLRHAFGESEKDLSRAYARIQVRSDHGGGNPRIAFLDGSTNARFDVVSDTPLDLREPTGPHERVSSAYVEGGLVPRGMVFLVESVDLSIDIDGGEHPRVDSLVRVGPYPVLWIEDDRRGGFEEPGWLLFTVDDGIRRVSREDLHLRLGLRVSIPIRREEEKFVLVEGAMYTRNDVVLEGRLVPEGEAPTPAAQSERMHAWQHYLKRILMPEAPAQAVTWVPRIPGLLPWLRGLRSMAVDVSYRARLDRVIEHLEAEGPR